MPLNVRILDALAKKSKSLVALRRAGGSPSTTTMRMHMRTLARAGVVERRGRDGFTNSATFGLTPAGQELLEVAAVLKAWLASAPGPELEFGSVDAAGKVSTLVAGWSAGIVRLLAARPLSPAELDQIVKSRDVGSLERQLGGMSLAGLTELLARFYAGRGIRVCGIAPSVTLVSGPQSRTNFDQVHTLNALGRGVDVDEIVAALRFIVATPTLTGQTITLDGGQRFLALPRDVQFLSPSGDVRFRETKT